MKNSLFQLNLSVHNLLAEVSTRSARGSTPSFRGPNPLFPTHPLVGFPSHLQQAGQLGHVTGHLSGHLEQPGHLAGHHQQKPGHLGGHLEQAKDLQGEVVGLYSLWDNAHHKMAAGLSNTQVSQPPCIHSLLIYIH